MVEAMHEAGTQTLKHRGGMPFLGATRIFGLNRVANMLALLDVSVRKVEPDKSLGGRAWDSYSWHTDLPPGHPMVTGQQTVEFDLFTAENAKLITLWGMNWISTKMPDGHWLTEARLRGAKIITIATEYQSTSCKADQVLVIRPGTDTALALGLSHVILRDKLYDADFVKNFTDLPFLVRMDTLKLLNAADVLPGYRAPALENYVQVLKPADKTPPNFQQGEQLITEAQRKTWGDLSCGMPGKTRRVPLRAITSANILPSSALTPRSKGRLKSQRPMASQSRCARFSIWKKRTWPSSRRKTYPN